MGFQGWCAETDKFQSEMKLIKIPLLMKMYKCRTLLSIFQNQINSVKSQSIFSGDFLLPTSDTRTSAEMFPLVHHKQIGRVQQPHVRFQPLLSSSPLRVWQCHERPEGWRLQISVCVGGANQDSASQLL